MHEDLIHCMDEEHSNDKKISFVYPENDLDSTAPIPTVPKKKIEKVKDNNEDIEDTEELVTEIKEEDIENNEEFNDDYEEEEYFEEPKRRNTLIIILSSFLLILLIVGALFWLVTTREVKDLTVPNVVGLSTDEAIEKLQKAGFTYTTEPKSSDTVEEGYVIKTSPKAGSTRKKGDTITIFESTGGVFHYLEDYTGKNYTEVKAKLELLNIHVLVEKKDVEDKEKYKGKENIIIDQTPKFNDKEKTEIKDGDTITIYIPNIVDEYPDMVSEGWSLSDALAFAKEYKLNISVLDKNNKVITDDKYSEYTNSTIIEQSGRLVGDPIIEGMTFKVKLNVELSNNESDE